MSEVRTDPLTPEEIARYHEQGFLFPIRVLDDEQVEEAREALDDHLEGRRESQQYELTDPIVDSTTGATATVGSGTATAVVEKTEVEKKPHSVPFLFNLWERDERFWKIDANPVIAGMARQLLGSEGVVLMEDGAVSRSPSSAAGSPGTRTTRTGRSRRPARSRAGSRSTTSAARTAACRSPSARTSSARSSRSSSATAARSCTPSGPASARCRQPEEAGLEVVGYELKAGECGFHHALIWHASGPNTSPNPRRGFIPRYVAGGDDLARRASLPLQLHRRGARVRSRASRSTARTSRASRPRSEIGRSGRRRGVATPLRRRGHAQPGDAPPVVRVRRDLDAALACVAEEAAQPAHAALVGGEHTQSWKQAP